MARLLDDTPRAFANRIAKCGGRAFVARDRDGNLRASHAFLAEFRKTVAAHAAGGRAHDGVFFGVGPSSGALFTAFVHRTERGQAQGGCRYWHYDRMESLLTDGLRLAVGMGRKSALAGLWWGGGKAIVARPQDADHFDSEARLEVFAEFGAFVSSLRGCYVTAEDAGTTPVDIAEVHRHSRFVTCVPPEAGGSGNPSSMTAAGVVRAIEAGLDFLGVGSLRGTRVAMQGAGNVGSAMIGRLLERGVSKIVVSEISEERCADLRDHFGTSPVDVVRCDPGDSGILAEPCDVLVPNALGGVLDAKTIAEVQAKLVCGAANNPLADDERDNEHLQRRGITYVPDFVANRMGIVNCANEQYGNLPRDPAIERHFDGPGGWADSVYNVTRRVLARARDEGTTPVAAANRLADDLAARPHPIWGNRARDIVVSLVEGHWIDETR